MQQEKTQAEIEAHLEENVIAQEPTKNALPPGGYVWQEKKEAAVEKTDKDTVHKTMLETMNKYSGMLRASLQAKNAEALLRETSRVVAQTNPSMEERKALGAKKAKEVGEADAIAQKLQTIATMRNFLGEAGQKVCDEATAFLRLLLEAMEKQDEALAAEAFEKRGAIAAFDKLMAAGTPPPPSPVREESSIFGNVAKRFMRLFSPRRE